MRLGLCIYVTSSKYLISFGVWHLCSNLANSVSFAPKPYRQIGTHNLELIFWTQNYGGNSHWHSNSDTWLVQWGYVILHHLFRRVCQGLNQSMWGRWLYLQLCLLLLLDHLLVLLNWEASNCLCTSESSSQLSSAGKLNHIPSVLWWSQCDQQLRHQLLKFFFTAYTSLDTGNLVIYTLCGCNWGMVLSFLYYHFLPT